MAKRPIALRGQHQLARYKAAVSLGMFDERPMEIGGFTFRARSAVAVGRPTIEQWQQAYEFACNALDASPYWIGDLLAYAENRKDWKEKFEQLKSITGYAEQTLYNLTSVSRHVDEEERRRSPSIGHSAVVVPMKDKREQAQWLDRARTEGWSVGEFRNEVRASSRTKIIEGQAVLEGMYRVLYADPPWLYGDSGATADGSIGKAERHFPGMTIQELCDLPVKAHVLPNAIMFLWCTAPFLLLNPGPREVIEAWGFEYKTGAVWDKVLGNYGHYFHIQHEHLLVCTRGSCVPDHPTPSPKSVITERRSDEHSEKPEEVRRTIERLYTTGPYLELFGRKPVEGWSVFGNDARLWAQDAEKSA